jgi:hypothetical protein
MKTETNKYINEVWSQYQKYSRAPGMGNYGRGLEIQRENYQKLPLAEKRKYEEAILTLCQDDDVQKANFALYTCSNLADIFPADWAGRVISLAEILVKGNLQPRYKETVTYATLRLIWEFQIQSLIPIVRNFRELITTNFKQGTLARGEWEYLYGQVSRIFIRVSLDDFWKEFVALHQDRELLDLLGSETKAVISLWVSFGTVTYGLDWLTKIVTEFSKYSNKMLKSQALLSVKQSFSIVVWRDPTKRASKREFLDWAAGQLTDS